MINNIRTFLTNNTITNIDGVLFAIILFVIIPVFMIFAIGIKEKKGV